MGSYISLGFVYQNDQNISLNLKQLLDLIITPTTNVIYKASYDLNGEDWIEKKLVYSEFESSDLNHLINHHYGNMRFKSSFLGLNDLLVNVTVYKSNHFYGFLVDLFEDYFKIDYLDIEDLITDFVFEHYQTLTFDYAFLDHDGEIEIDPQALLEEEIDYSVLIFKDLRGNLLLKKGSYLLDGLTLR